MLNGETQYYIVGHTSNQFDKPMLLYLGKLGEAKTSLNQLLNELYIVGQQYELVDKSGSKFWASAQNSYGTARYAIKQKGYAGFMFLPLQGIRKMLTALDYIDNVESLESVENEEIVKSVDFVDAAHTTYVVYGMKAGVSLKYTKLGEQAEYFLQLNTNNQFDGAMFIYLGNRDKARTSLSQLLNEMHELGKEYTLNDTHGKPFKAVCSNTMGAKGYAIFKDDCAGCAYIRLKQLADMLEKM